MARQAWLLTVGLALHCGAVGGCLRTAEKAGGIDRQPKSRLVESQVTPAAATGVYAPLSSPQPPTPPTIRENKPRPIARRDANPQAEEDADPKPSGPKESTGTRKFDSGPDIDALDFPKAKPPSEHPLVTALQCRLDKRPEEARRLLDSYDPARQDFIFAMLGVLARFADPVPNKSESPCAGELIEDLKALVEPLRCRAPLKIEKICFCQRIQAYGIYEPVLERPQFRTDDRVQIYVELRNFSSIEQKLATGEIRHLIKLMTSYEIHDENRNIVHSDVFLRDRDAADESRTARHDYFENYVFMVPKLKPGFYTLWIKIEDMGTRPSRTVKASLEFHVPNTPVQISRGTD